jgi:enoyl-CoA hydratase
VLLTIEPGNGNADGTAKTAITSAADILESLGKELRTAFEKESRLSSAIFRTEDAKEGPKAFAEKRAPNWQGR